MDNTKINQALQQLDEKAEALQKQGKYGESLDILEEILNLKRKTYGEDSDQYYKTSEKLCELCNLIAMICLQKEKFEASLDFLKKAETLALNSLNYKAITYNNLACYYRRTNKLRTALQYLEKALKIEITLHSPQTLADTHLNLCAVLSQLNRHQEALEHVLLSIVYLQDEVNGLQIDKLQRQVDQQNNNEKEQEQQQEEESQENNEDKEKQEKTLDDRLSVLAIAYHNMGVELEYLKRFEEAIQTYTKAVGFAEKYLGKDHQLVENLNNVRESAIQQIEEQKNKDSRRKGGKGGTGNTQRINRVTGLYQETNARPKTYGYNQTGQNYYQNQTSNQFYGGNQQQQLRKQNSNSSNSKQQNRPINNQQQQQQQQQMAQQYEDEQQDQQYQDQQEEQYQDQQGNSGIQDQEK